VTRNDVSPAYATVELRFSTVTFTFDVPVAPSLSVTVTVARYGVKPLGAPYDLPRALIDIQSAH
jgi:hypothetical protein